MLASFRASGCGAAVMEVSSHALALHRVDGTVFDAVVFTNLGRDHFDLHGSTEEYFRAKARLFDPSFAPLAVVNVDDTYGGCSPTRSMETGSDDLRVVRISIDDLDAVVVNGTSHSYRWGSVDVTVPIGGHFNVANSHAALVTAVELGIDPQVAVAGLAGVTPIPGRFEAVQAATDRGLTVVVDYAHTPDGLAEVLRSARAIADPGSIVAIVFGAGGDRDREKRPEMGAVAARLADRVIVTSDNPRHEDPDAIIGDILGGMNESDVDIRVEPDRRTAIAAALAPLAPGDVLVVAGKGHERTQDLGDRVVDFDDRAVITELLEETGVIAIMLSGATAMIVSLFGTRWLITFFRTRGQGQPILGKEDHGPDHHMHKQGTPTMGGLAIVVRPLVGWLVAHIRPGLAFSDQTMIVWVGVLFMALMGFLDDFIKVRKRHNRGIFWKQKNYLTMIASFGFAWWLVVATGISETISVTRADVGFEVPTVVWIIWAGHDHLGDDQRGQRDRRSRRSGLRIGADGLRRVHDHRLLGVP